MENPDKSQFNGQLRERTLQMATVIFRLLNDKKVPPIIRPAVNQIIRSSSSVAANCRAAMRARSDAEYYSKICIVVEECDETYFWLEYLSRIGLLAQIEMSGITHFHISHFTFRI
jgi:four helix bundle protein